MQTAQWVYIVLRGVRHNLDGGFMATSAEVGVDQLCHQATLHSRYPCVQLARLLRLDLDSIYMVDVYMVVSGCRCP